MQQDLTYHVIDHPYMPGTQQILQMGLEFAGVDALDLFIVPVVRITHLCRNRRQGKSVFIECWLFWPGVMDRDWSHFGPEIVARGFVGRLKTQAVRLDRAVHSITRKKSESALHRLRHDGRPRQALFPQATTWYVSVQCQGEVEVCEFHGSPAGERSMSKDGEGKPVIGSALTVSVAVMYVATYLWGPFGEGGGGKGGQLASLIASSHTQSPGTATMMAAAVGLVALANYII